MTVKFCGTTDSYFEIDCQIIGSKHFLVSTRFSLKQKPIIISNLKFESTFWSLSIFLKKKKEFVKLLLVDDETCIFTRNNFPKFVLVLVMLHSTNLGQITFAYVII